MDDGRLASDVFHDVDFPAGGPSDRGDVVAQHPDGCDVYGMPKSVVDEQLADQLVPLQGIADTVIKLATTSRRSHMNINEKPQS